MGKQKHFFYEELYLAPLILKVHADRKKTLTNLK